MRRLTAIAGTISLLTLTALPNGAMAMSTHTTPNGSVGAMNMLQDATMAPGTGGPMDRDNANGNTGMFHATCVSAGQFC